VTGHFTHEPFSNTAKLVSFYLQSFIKHSFMDAHCAVAVNLTKVGDTIAKDAMFHSSETMAETRPRKSAMGFSSTETRYRMAASNQPSMEENHATVKQHKLHELP
jgi:hypothetical protein